MWQLFASRFLLLTLLAAQCKQPVEKRIVARLWQRQYMPSVDEHHNGLIITVLFRLYAGLAQAHIQITYPDVTSGVPVEVNEETDVSITVRVTKQSERVVYKQRTQGAVSPTHTREKLKGAYMSSRRG